MLIWISNNKNKSNIPSQNVSKNVFGEHIFLWDKPSKHTLILKEIFLHLLQQVFSHGIELHKCFWKLCNFIYNHELNDSEYQITSKS